tara:strand:+ start:3241 stop:3492 length:252 start_codon:yes stop_codon:yes gene_type:complete
MGLISDHHETPPFTYKRTWDEIEIMLDKAERVKNIHEVKMSEQRERGNSKRALHHAKNVKALEGVVKTLRWTLGDKDITHPLD